MVGPAPAGAPVPAGTPRPPAKGPGACAPRQVQPRRGYLPRPAPFKMAAQLGPTIIQGAKLGRIRLAARQTSPRARRPDRPRKGARPLGVGPLTQQARTKCKGGPAQKEKRRGRAFYPCILAGAVVWRFPRPGQPTGQGTTGSAGPQKGIKGPVLAGGPQPPALQCRG